MGSRAVAPREPGDDALEQGAVGGMDQVAAVATAQLERAEAQRLCGTRRHAAVGQVGRQQRHAVEGVLREHLVQPGVALRARLGADLGGDVAQREQPAPPDR